MKYISADYIKAIMKSDRLMQGNCEYELWKQEVDKKVDAMPSIDVMGVKRTEAEIKAYVDGYNACFKQFKECLKGRKSVIDSIRKMDLFVSAVNSCVECEPQTEREGEWIAKTENDHSHWVCSECGAWALLEYNEQMCLSNFCPNCGARMKGAKQ